MARTQIDWLAWWQILRVANVFTAASNIIAGFLLVQRDWQPLAPLVLLILASVCLYEAGMVLNDVFDAELDAIERPERPIPSGRINKENAYRVGLVLLGGGVLAAYFAWQFTEQFPTILIAVFLAFAMIVYDAWAKSTLCGPLVMGLCRFLNILLGASVAHSLLDQSAPLLWATGIGIYTVGLTLIARREAVVSRSGELVAGGVLVFCGLIVALFLPAAIEVHSLRNISWMAIVLVLLGFLGYLTYRLLQDPAQPTVRQTVGALISLFIPLDAAASALAAGWSAGGCVLLLLVPVRLLSRWTGQT